MTNSLKFQNPSIQDLLSLYHHDLIEIYKKEYDRTYYRLYQKFLSDFCLIMGAYDTSKCILDLGCAQGNFTLSLAKKGFAVTALDINSAFIEYTRAKTYKFADKINYVNCNLYDFKPDILFDVIFAGEIIEHVNDPKAFLSKVSSLLNDGGVLILTTPNQSYCRNKLPSFNEVDLTENTEFFPDGDGHTFLFNVEEIKSIVDIEGSLKLKEIHFYRSLFLSGHLLLRKIHWLIPEFIHYRIEDFLVKYFKIHWFYSQTLFKLTKVSSD